MELSFSLDSFPLFPYSMIYDTPCSHETLASPTQIFLIDFSMDIERHSTTDTIIASGTR